MTTETIERPTRVRFRSPREVGEAAAALIEERGWWGGGRERETGQVCIMIALSRVTSFPHQVGEFSLTLEALYPLMGIGPRYANTLDLVQWNDAPERTEAEVLNLLRSVT